MNSYKYCLILILVTATASLLCSCQPQDGGGWSELKFKVTENSNPDNISVHITSRSPVEVFVGNEGGTLTLEANHVFTIHDLFGNSSLYMDSYGRAFSVDFTDDSDWYILKKDKDSNTIQITFLKTDDDSPRETYYYMDGIYLTPVSLKIYKNNISE